MSDAILNKIQKLIALRDNKGATEAEATLAGETVQRLLQDYGLTMAQVEAAGGNTADAGGKREKLNSNRRAMYTYQRKLMEAIARNYFCMYTITTVKNAKPLYSGGRGKTSRVHVLVGRSINVKATELMYEYLDSTMRRLAAEQAGIDLRQTSELTTFLEGATTTLVERLNEKRRQAELESMEAEAARRNTQGNGTGRELVLTDVYGTEEDLNNDHLNGFPPGTTLARRLKANEEAAKRQAREDELVAQGMDRTQAFYMAYGYGEAEAKTYAEAWRTRSHRSGGRGRSQGWTRADEQHAQKINSPAYKAGRTAGSEIGLDTQVGRNKRKLLS